MTTHFHSFRLSEIGLGTSFEGETSNDRNVRKRGRVKLPPVFPYEAIIQAPEFSQSPNYSFNKFPSIDSEIQVTQKRFRTMSSPFPVDVDSNMLSPVLRKLYHQFNDPYITFVRKHSTFHSVNFNTKDLPEYTYEGHNDPNREETINQFKDDNESFDNVEFDLIDAYSFDEQERTWQQRNKHRFNLFQLQNPKFHRGDLERELGFRTNVSATDNPTPEEFVVEVGELVFDLIKNSPDKSEEPLFCTLFLLDATNKHKLSEDWSFTVSPNQVIKRLGDASKFHPFSNSHRAIFKIFKKDIHDQVYLVLQVSQILVNDPDKMLVPYIRKSVKKQKDADTIMARMDLFEFKTELCWSAIPIYQKSEDEGMFGTKNKNAPTLVGDFQFKRLFQGNNTSIDALVQKIDEFTDPKARSHAKLIDGYMSCSLMPVNTFGAFTQPQIKNLALEKPYETINEQVKNTREGNDPAISSRIIQEEYLRLDSRYEQVFDPPLTFTQLLYLFDEMEENYQSEDTSSLSNGKDVVDATDTTSETPTATETSTETSTATEPSSDVQNQDATTTQEEEETPVSAISSDLFPTPEQTKASLKNNHYYSDAEMAQLLANNRTLTEVQPFPINVPPAFNFEFTNLLYVYPKSINLSGVTWKGRNNARNIAVSVELKISDKPNAEGIPCLVASCHKDLFAKVLYSSVTYREKSPTFTTEFKVLLPHELTPQHHLVFNFHHIVVERKKNKKAEAIQHPVATAVFPLFKNGQIQRPPEQGIPLLKHMGQAFFSPNQNDFYEPEKFFFFDTHLVSTVYTDDPHLATVFRASDSLFYSKLVDASPSDASPMKLGFPTLPTDYHPEVVEQQKELSGSTAILPQTNSQYVGQTPGASPLSQGGITAPVEQMQRRGTKLGSLKNLVRNYAAEGASPSLTISNPENTYIFHKQVPILAPEVSAPVTQSISAIDSVSVELLIQHFPMIFDILLHAVSMSKTATPAFNAILRVVFRISEFIKSQNKGSRGRNASKKRNQLLSRFLQHVYISSPATALSFVKIAQQTFVPFNFYKANPFAVGEEHLMLHTWFFFDLIDRLLKFVWCRKEIDSLLLRHYAVVNLYKKHASDPIPKPLFNHIEGTAVCLVQERPRYRNELFFSHLTKLTAEFIDCLRKGVTCDYTIAKDANRYFAIFIKDLFSSCDRGVVIDLIDYYLEDILLPNSALPPPTSRTIHPEHDLYLLHELHWFKFDFLDIVADYEHFLRLNLPFGFSFDFSKPDITGTILSHHFLMGVFIRDIFKTLIVNNGSSRRRAFRSLNRFFSRVDYEESIQDPIVKRSLARSLFSIVSLAIELWENNVIPAWEIVANDSEKRTLYSAILWVLRNIDVKFLRNWLKTSIDGRLVIFCQLLENMNYALTFQKDFRVPALPETKNLKKITVTQGTSTQTSTPGNITRRKLFGTVRGKRGATPMLFTGKDMSMLGSPSVGNSRNPSPAPPALTNPSLPNGLVAPNPSNPRTSFQLDLAPAAHSPSPAPSRTKRDSIRIPADQVNASLKGIDSASSSGSSQPSSSSSSPGVPEAPSLPGSSRVPAPPPLFGGSGIANTSTETELEGIVAPGTDLAGPLTNPGRGGYFGSKNTPIPGKANVVPEYFPVKSQPELPSVKKLLTRLEQCFIHECQVVILELMIELVNSRYLQMADYAHGVSPLFVGVYSVLMGQIESGRSVEFYESLFSVLRMFILRFRHIFFGANNEYLAGLLENLLRLGNSHIEKIRVSAAQLLYFCMFHNFEQVANFSSFNVCLSVGLSAAISSFNDEATLLKRCLRTVPEYAMLEFGSCPTAFSLTHSRLFETTNSQQADYVKFKFAHDVQVLCDRMIQALQDTLTVRMVNKEDPIDHAELLANIADGYQHTPALRIQWLDFLSKFHKKQKCFAEAAQCKILMAAIGAEFLKEHSDRPIFHEMNLKSFQTVCPSLRSGIDLGMTHADEGLGSIFSESQFISWTEQAISHLTKAYQLEWCNELYKLLIPVYESNSQFIKLKKAHDALGEIFEQQHHDKRQESDFPTYFRINFVGECFRKAFDIEEVLGDGDQDLGGKRHRPLKPPEPSASSDVPPSPSIQRKRNNLKSSNSQLMGNDLTINEEDLLAELDDDLSGEDETESNSVSPAAPAAPAAPALPGSIPDAPALHVPPPPGLSAPPLPSDSNKSTEKTEFFSIAYVYKEPPMTHLFQYMKTIPEQWSKKLGGVKIEIIKSSGQVDHSTLDPTIGYLQITKVNPYFDEKELSDREESLFAKSVHVSEFYYTTPLNKDNEASESFKKRILETAPKLGGRDKEKWEQLITYNNTEILTVEGAFPCTKRRLRIINQSHHQDPPIAVAVQMLNEQVKRLDVETKAATKKTLLQFSRLLSGSIIPMVQAGVRPWADLYLKNPYWFPEKYVLQLQAAFRLFLVACQNGLNKHEALRSRQELTLHQEMVNGLASLKEFLKEPLSPAPLAQSRLRHKRRARISAKIEQMIMDRNKARISNSKRDSILSTKSGTTTSSSLSQHSDNSRPSSMALQQPIPILAPPPPPGWTPPPLSADGFDDLLSDDDNDDEFGQSSSLMNQEQINQLPVDLRPESLLDAFLYDSGIKSAWDVYMMPEPLQSKQFKDLASENPDLFKNSGLVSETEAVATADGE